MDSKKPWQSKMLVVNALMGLVAFVSLVYPPASVAGEFIKAHGAEIGIVWSMLNVVLRLVTKDKIALGE